MIFGAISITIGIVATDKSVVNPTDCEAYEGEIEYIEPNIVVTAAEGIAAAIVQKITVSESKFSKVITEQTSNGSTISFINER